MPYIANTDEQRREMLRTIGASSFAELLDGIPPETLTAGLDLPAGLSEMETLAKMRALSETNRVFPPGRMYAGSGMYNHFIPPVVSQLATRSEFFTAYTPYQPEVSQGMLQTIFEYQTYVCELTGLEVSNASSYDGASACADAVNMALGATKRKKVILSGNLHPHARETFETYNIGWKLDILPLPYRGDFEIDIERLDSMLAGGDVACVVVQIPNFFGCFESGLAKLGGICHKHKTILAAGWYPFCAGWVKRPGDIGADIAYGEGQPLGIPLGFGGPGLGFLACRKDLVRFLPGRLIGQTEDANGKTAYVMTLQAREQHIRRDKANSSICTNQALMALTATIYLSCIGKEGFRRVGELESAAAHRLAEMLAKVKGVRLAHPKAGFFNEFAIELSANNPVAVFERLVDRGFLPGIPLSQFGMADNQWLVATTEQHTPSDLEEFAKALSEEIGK